MIKLYGHEMSGNSYKPRLLLELLNIEYEWVKVDLMKGEHKSPEYLVLDSFGQVPLSIDGDTKLADAQAILVYLARQYGGDTWLPLDALPLAQVVRCGVPKMPEFIICLGLPVSISNGHSSKQNESCLN